MKEPTKEPTTYQSTDMKILATLELIHDSLNELVTVGKGLIDVTEKANKRQGSKETNFKEALNVFTAEFKPMIERLLTPQPLPEMPTVTPPPMKHEVKVLHLDKYIHNKPQLEIDLNKLVDENYILAGVTDYVMILHRYKIVVDAEFPDDIGEKVNVQ